MDIQKLIEIAKDNFPIQIESEQFSEEEKTLLKSKYHNDYLAIGRNNSGEGYIMNFFKSNNSDIWGNFLEFNVNFYPKDLEKAKCLIDACGV